MAATLQAAGADMTSWQPIDKYLLEVYGDVISDHSTTAVSTVAGAGRIIISTLT